MHSKKHILSTITLCLTVFLLNIQSAHSQITKCIQSDLTDVIHYILPSFEGKFPKKQKIERYIDELNQQIGKYLESPTDKILEKITKQMEQINDYAWSGKEYNLKGTAHLMECSIDSLGEILQTNEKKNKDKNNVIKVYADAQHIAGIIASLQGKQEDARNHFGIASQNYEKCDKTIGKRGNKVVEYNQKLLDIKQKSNNPNITDFSIPFKRE